MRTVSQSQIFDGAAAAGLVDPTWEAFVGTHPYGHVLQSGRWADLKAAFGWRAGRVVVRSVGAEEQPGPITAGASILFRRLPWGQSLAYVPKGPLWDWCSEEEARRALDPIIAACRRQHAALLKIEPETVASPETEQLLRRLGFHPSAQHVQPLSTVHLDLNADDEVILSRMKPKWRYNVRLAERKGVTVREGSESDFPAIQRLLEVTGERDGFGVHSEPYYRRALALFGPPGLATWLIAEHEGQMLAAIAVFALGHAAWYMWGASGEAGRNLMPNHALQWAAIRWARSRGAAVYDLWGIPDEVGENPAAFAEPESWGEGGLWGVYRFKQGFGGQVVRYTGAWDLPLSPVGHLLYWLALRVRRGMAEG